MRIQCLLPLMPLLAGANPLPLASEPIEFPDVSTSDSLSTVDPSDIAFTLFTDSCDRSTASYQVYTYDTAGLGTCQSVEYQPGCPCKFLEMDQLPSEVLSVKDTVLRFYSDKHCQFSEEDHKLEDLTLNKCARTTGGRSLKVLRVAESKHDGDALLEPGK